MTLLKQLEEWATGSTLNKDVKKLRLKLQLIGSVFLFTIFLSSSLMASNVYNSLTPKNSVDIILRSRLQNSMVDRATYDVLREKLEEERQDKFINSLLVSNAIIFWVIILTLWFGLFYVLKPMSDTMDEKEKFLKYASHDLRTPLAIMSSNLGLIDENSKKNEMLEVINESKTEIKRLQKLANSYLSKLGKNNSNSDLININLKKEIENVIKMLKSDKGFVVEIKENDEIEIENKNSFNQLIYNLIDNMIRHGEGENRIYYKEGNLYFENNIIKNNFENGVGLSICKELCNELNIGFTVKTQKDKFRVIVRIK